MLLRNKELKLLALSLFSISAILLVVSFVIDIITGIFVFITIILLALIFITFTRKRYRDIKVLTAYLQKIVSGDYSLDLRNHVEGELSILRSEINKVTAMLTEYNEQLKQDQLLLSKQMAEISHQIKTPLTSMMVMVELLEKEDLPVNKRREFSALINNQLKRIEWLLSALLKMSKLDAGVIKMKSEKVNVLTLIENSLKPFLISMELKDISYQVETRDHEIICDFEWTTEALINIIKNGIEHTPQGGQINIQVLDNLLYTEIQISDTGIGINKEDLPHIFTRFYRGKNASPDSVGIGLAMSQEIIRKQFGDLQVKSEVGKGSTFLIRLYKSVI